MAQNKYIRSSSSVHNIDLNLSALDVVFRFPLMTPSQRNHAEWRENVERSVVQKERERRRKTLLARSSKGEVMIRVDQLGHTVLLGRRNFSSNISPK